MKVYTETAAHRSKLRKLAKEYGLELVYFPYEQPSSRAKYARPSLVTVDTTHLTCDSTIPIGDMVGSEKLHSIRKILGRGKDTEKDARHLDSAYKSGCACFLTTDKGDILSRAKNLEELLNLKIFHPDEDWDRFVEFVRADGDPR